MKKIILTLLLILPVLFSQGQPDNGVLKIGSKVSIHSKTLNETRDVWVYLPPNYEENYFQAARYPVIYILDGDVHFHSVSGLVQILGSGVNGTFVIPEMIVVAIPNTDRTRDLTPTHTLLDPNGKSADFLKSSGGGDNFLTFLKDEVIPKIDSGYRTSPYRVFVGHSFGGIAVINALFTIPQTFNAYISIDPSLWWDNKILLTRGKEFFKNADLKGKSLFVAQANTVFAEDTTNIHFESIQEFSTLLKTRNRTGLKWNFKYYENDNHGSVPFIAEYDALRFIFDKYYADFNTILSAKELKEHYQRFADEQKIGSFIPPERVVQQFGSVATYRKKYDLAKEYFQMNIDNFPKSSAAYANMGQLLVTMGDKRKALEYYEKSVKLNPGNDDAKNNVRSIREELKIKN